MFAYTKLMQAMAAAGVVSATDPYFNLVTLLLPGNGTNGAQNNTFLDSSTNNFTITRNGNTTQGTFSPFSQTGWSNYFDGSGDYLSVPSSTSLQLTNATSFCIEAWVFPTSFSGGTGDYAIIGKRTGSTTEWQFFVKDLSGAYTLRVYNGSSDYNSGTTITATNQWVHVAVTWDGTTLRFFINGTLCSNTYTTFSLGTPGSANVNIGSSNGSSEYWNGSISNLRVVKGSAVYTSSFTPSTTPLTSITNTSLLTCQSNRFIDNSTNAYTITSNGNVSVQAFSPFAPTAAYSAATNGASGYFDGTGDYVSAPSSSQLEPGSGDFTVEAWIYPRSYPAAGTGDGIVTRANASGYANFSVTLRSNGQIEGYCSLSNPASVPNIITAGSVSLNTWTHVAFVKSGLNYSLYVGGSRVGTTSSASNPPTGISTITRIGNADSDFDGYISDVRIAKAAVYSGTTLTVPTAPLTAITNTSLLLNFTNGGIIDATGKNVLETVGNAQISTTQSKFGGSSMYFDGTGDRLTTRFIPIQDLSGGDWTIEFWMNFGSSVPTTFRSIAGASNGGGAVPKWLIIANANTSYTYQANRLMFATYNGADRQLNVGFTWATNTWYHIAIVQNGGTTTLYIDGVSQGTMAYNIGSGITAGVIIGADGEGYSEFTGYIDDLRITKGYARYTANFSVPTAAFPLQ